LNQKTDRISFAVTILVILMVSVPLLFAPEAGADLIQRCYDFVASYFGVFYASAGCAALLLLLWLAFGRYGEIKLGDANDKPRFSTYSWTGMLFCAGVGAGKNDPFGKGGVVS
jgi:BCCT family betaine/carnitine transporter